MGVEVNASQSTKNFFIPEPDLTLLEKSLAVLHDSASMSPNYMTADVQVAAETAKEILSNVRWSYGPFSHSERIEGYLGGLDACD
jgi:hypothetical protein